MFPESRIWCLKWQLNFVFSKFKTKEGNINFPFQHFAWLLCMIKNDIDNFLFQNVFRNISTFWSMFMENGGFCKLLFSVKNPIHYNSYWNLKYIALWPKSPRKDKTWYFVGNDVCSDIFNENLIMTFDY